MAAADTGPYNRTHQPDRGWLSRGDRIARADSLASELIRIVYVDDDADVCDLVEVALESAEGVQLRIYRSAADALRACPGFQPQLVVMDVNMPEIDGVTAFHEFRERGDTVPVAFATADNRDEELARLMNLGAAGVLVKPFDPTTLMERLHGIWRRATHSLS